MTTTGFFRTLVRAASLVAVASVAASCGIEKQAPPALSGPSELGLSIRLTANPDTLDRDGVSPSTISIVARTADDRPWANRWVRLHLTPSNGGLLSANRIQTGPDGRATVTYTAPSLNTALDSVMIEAMPEETDAANTVARYVTVRLAAPGAATPDFTVTPANPERFGLTVLDASSTTLDGVPCGPRCTYAWTLGSEATRTGQVINYRFQQEGSYTVVLDVTSEGGVTTRTQRNVTVGPAVLPTPSFTISPSDPQIGDMVRFDASGSTAPNGASIVEYTWNFGNGQTGSGVTASTTFPLARTYKVQLTVRDSNGLTASVTADVTVSEP